jgi:hypothetical protein
MGIWFSLQTLKLFSTYKEFNIFLSSNKLGLGFKLQNSVRFPGDVGITMYWLCGLVMKKEREI